MKAILSNYRQSPRKVRLVASLMKGKPVAQSMNELDALTKRAALPLKKLISSAVANARHNFETAEGELVIKSMRVDKGTIMKRSMPRARGSASPIWKRSSHIVVELERVGGEAPVKAIATKSAKAEVKKAAPAKKTSATASKTKAKK